MNERPGSSESAPRPSMVPGLAATDAVWRCPICKSPVFAGRLGEGTHIKVVCRRHGCPHHDIANPYDIRWPLTE